MFGINNLPDANTQTIAQRNAWWAMLISRLLMDQEHLRESIPTGFTIYVLPSSDPELCQYNRRLVDGQPDDANILLIEVKMQPAQKLAIRQFRPTGPTVTYAYA